MRTYLMTAVLVFLFPLTAFAGGGATGGATEFTQIMNNTQLVASYAEQAQQTVTQLNQYAAMLRNLQAATPPQLLATAAAKLWHDQNMIQTFRNLNTIVVGGQTVAYSLSNMDAQFRQAHPGYQASAAASGSYGQMYQNWSDNTLNAVRNAIAMVGAQQQNFASEEQMMQTLQDMSSNPQGQVRAIQAGNAVGIAMVSQMQQLRQLQMAQIAQQGAYITSGQDKSNANQKALDDCLNQLPKNNPVIQ